jgi:hypothetical protein
MWYDEIFFASNCDPPNLSLDYRHELLAPAKMEEFYVDLFKNSSAFQNFVNVLFS